MSAWKRNECTSTAWKITGTCQFLTKAPKNDPNLNWMSSFSQGNAFNTLVVAYKQPVRNCVLLGWIKLGKSRKKTRGIKLSFEKKYRTGRPSQIVFWIPVFPAYLSVYIILERCCPRFQTNFCSKFNQDKFDIFHNTQNSNKA